MSKHSGGYSLVGCQGAQIHGHLALGVPVRPSWNWGQQRRCTRDALLFNRCCLSALHRLVAPTGTRGMQWACLTMTPLMPLGKLALKVCAQPYPKKHPSRGGGDGESRMQGCRMRNQASDVLWCTSHCRKMKQRCVHDTCFPHIQIWKRKFQLIAPTNCVSVTRYLGTGKRL